MDFTSRYRRTIVHVRTRRPTYFLGYGGGVLVLFVVAGLSLSRGWYAFVLMASVGLVVLLYFLVASLWAYHALYDDENIRDTLFELGELTPTTTIVDINLGLRRFAIALSRKLTVGQVIALDVYNPNQAPNQALARAHHAVERPEADPRLSWRDGSINLLPLPDNSVPAVTLIQTTSELWQEGDRLKLLQETHRILAPGGCLLVAERVRTPINLVVSGPAGLRFRPATYWLELLERSNFKISARKSQRDLMLCIRADKRQVGEQRPLPVDQ